jgi:hypothetical protein
VYPVKNVHVRKTYIFLTVDPVWAERGSPETHTKRQATQHGCLPSLLGHGDKGIEIVWGKRQNINLLYRHAKPNKPAKEGPLSFVIFESPFTSVSTVSRGHP